MRTCRIIVCLKHWQIIFSERICERERELDKERETENNKGVLERERERERNTEMEREWHRDTKRRVTVRERMR